MLDFNEKAKQLLIAQKNDWPTARKNYSDLENVQVRVFDFNGFLIKVQFNPVRIVSSAAKVDQQSIASRKCFLCAENRPTEQQQLVFGNYEILVNPFPIFPEHFTIPGRDHAPQQMAGRFGEMLDLAEVLHDFTIFYNGPKCGASAPDHFHFQAGKKGFMPLESEIENLKQKKGTKLAAGSVDVWAINDGIRNFLFMESFGKANLESCFNSIYEKLDFLNELVGEEPMMNILAGYENGKWQVFIFPRFRHRPWQYFDEGEANILLSPASVDLGGVLITPLEKDFGKITKADIVDIFYQILWPAEKFDSLVKSIF